ncbi:MAG: VOC family protein [Parvibaculaceae bacterium]
MATNERFQNQSMKQAAFKDCAMAGTSFDDVDLTEAVFSNVNLAHAKLNNVNLTDVSIDDANINGLTIFGYDIKALIREHEDAMAMSAEPQLFTADMDAACRFYTGQLGFTLAILHGEPPFYAQINRGRWKLNLRHTDGTVFNHRIRTSETNALSATLTLNDAKPLFAEYQAAGVTFHQPLTTESWGTETFIIADPDGNLIAFAGKPV